MAIQKTPFGQNCFGEAVDLFTLSSGSGLTVQIMNHGGTVVSLRTPDRTGTAADIVLGHDTAAEYTRNTPYFGCVIGRFANRIENGRFTLDGQTFQLIENDRPHTLHGGLRGFDKVIWNTEVLEPENALRMTYVSADGEENFPGEVTVVMTYTVTQANELRIDYKAESTKPTPFNITHHSYFNLAGHDPGDCGSHLLTIHADTFLPVDALGIPCDIPQPVDGTPFDFRRPESIGRRINDSHEQLRRVNGYDHNFCLSKTVPGELGLAARAEEPSSGRVMDVFTSEPGLQLYTGNFLDGSLTGKGGCRYIRRAGFCLETQHYPDSPNRPEFPDTILRPGNAYASSTLYRFAVQH